MIALIIASGLALHAGAAPPARPCGGDTPGVQTLESCTYFDGCNWHTIAPDGGETTTTIACPKPRPKFATGGGPADILSVRHNGLEVLGIGAEGTLRLDAPPCGTPEAKEWGVCVKWTIAPGHTAEKLWHGPTPPNQ